MFKTKDEVMNMFETRGELVFEIMKIKEIVRLRDGAKMKELYQQYTSMLQVPSREVYSMGTLKVSSPAISFHLLSSYLLLDLVDFFWDGRDFLNEKLRHQPALLEDLQLEELATFKNIDVCYSFLLQNHKIMKDPLHIFFLPRHSFKEYVLLDFTFPHNILLVFPKENEDGQSQTLDCLIKGLGEFYLKKELRGRLPFWADSLPAFLDEFTKWTKGEKSRFPRRKI